MHIRKLTQADVHSYIALRREMLADTPFAFGASQDDDDRGQRPESVIARCAGPESAIVGAFDSDSSDAKLLGVAVVAREEKLKRRHIAGIYSVYVTPASRGRGAGRAVVHAAIQIARLWSGVDRVALAVSSRTLPARRMYESLGFVAWGTEPGATKIGAEIADEIHMTLML